jgi:type III secretion protein T
MAAPVPEVDVFLQPAQLMATYAIAMPRLLMMFSMIPMLTRESLPGLLRFGVVAAMATLLVPGLLEPVAGAERDVLATAMLVGKESLLGVMLGFLVAVPLWAFDTMGSYIDNQRGASIAQTINPMSGHDSSPLGELFSQAALTYMLAGGGFVLILGIGYRSFELWPILSWTPHLSDETPQILLGQLDRLTRLAVLLGSPVILSMLLAEIGLALVSRFAPQLQVFFLAMPVKSGIAMFVFAVYAGTLFDIAHDDLLDANGALDGVKAMVGGGAK